MARRRRPPAGSWDRVAEHYRGLSARRPPEILSRVVYPEVLRMLGLLEGRCVLDVGCGFGAFARKMAARGAAVTGIDPSPRRIEIARQDAKEAQLDPCPQFDVADLHDRAAFRDEAFDAATLVLSLQRLEYPGTVLQHVRRALRPEGRLVMALHHPCFWIPGSAGWGFDPERHARFRRIDRYRSPHRTVPEGGGGRAREVAEPSFHWPLEWIFGALRRADFCVVDLVEPASDRTYVGGRGRATDRARREIPLFMALLARTANGGEAPPAAESE